MRVGTAMTCTQQQLLLPSTFKIQIGQQCSNLLINPQVCFIYSSNVNISNT